MKKLNANKGLLQAELPQNQTRKAFNNTIRASSPIFVFKNRAAMNNPVIIEETYDATAERVWQAITDKEQMKQWYFSIPDFELKVGAVFNFYEPGGANKYHHRCVIKEIVPNQKLQHSWTHPSHSKGESLLTWELKPEGATTKVKLTHSGIENLADGGKDFVRENYLAGWEELLRKSLKDFLANSNP